MPLVEKLAEVRSVVDLDRYNKAYNVLKMILIERSGLMRKVNKNITVPYYLQINEIIREMIDDGELQEGATVMSEREIAQLQDVSRMTVNKAFTKLVDEGYLIRQSGSGTTVAKKRPISRYGSIENLSEIQNTKLISFQEMGLTKWIKRKLQTESEWGYKVKRIRYSDGQPLAIESIYLSKEMCPDLTIDLLKSSPMHELYTHRYGHNLSQAEQIIKPIFLKEDQAELLEEEKGDLALQIKCQLYTVNQQVMEYTESIFLSQKNDFAIVLK